MKPITALGFIAIGGAVWIRHGLDGPREARWSRILAAVGLSVGGLKLIDDAIRWRVGIDGTVEDAERGAEASALGTMTPAIAVGLIVLGSSLLP